MRQAKRPLTAPRGLLALSVSVVLLASGTSILALDPPHDGSATPSIDCSDCHSMDTASTWSALITRGVEQEQQCKSCHNPTGQADSMSDVSNHNVTHDGTATIIDCGACHNGDIAWSVENCDLCHSGKSGTPTQVHESTLQKILSPSGTKKTK